MTETTWRPRGGGQRGQFIGRARQQAAPPPWRLQSRSGTGRLELGAWPGEPADPNRLFDQSAAVMAGR